MWSNGSIVSGSKRGQIITAKGWEGGECSPNGNWEWERECKGQGQDSPHRF